jgi:hypothetical protein
VIEIGAAGYAAQDEAEFVALLHAAQAGLLEALPLPEKTPPLDPDKPAPAETI